MVQHFRFYLLFIYQLFVFLFFKKAFINLTQTPYVNLCTEKGILEQPDFISIRLELYSDFLHALALSNVVFFYVFFDIPYLHTNINKISV